MAALQPGVYIIRNCYSGTTLDANTGVGLVIGWSHHGGDTQQWRLSKRNNGWALQYTKDSRYASPSNYARGVVIGLVPEIEFYNITQAEEEDAYKISPCDAPNLVLALHFNSTRDHAPVILWDEGKTRGQTWTLRRIGS
ncbi:unnamed protein product [Rhizoctonia solani]|uniref:Ricin B lectin domain-containing protein n=1 Tax=Rhizoctonia solani TaxID=456999 RepID=A0A8H3HN94_9AGAM|nr:unnamed protein product [Rhizoctonia solani]